MSWLPDYALSTLDGSLVDISDARTGLLYRCPECGFLVYKKASYSNCISPHFCHLPNQSDEACPGLSTHDRTVRYLSRFLHSEMLLELSAKHKVFNSRCSSNVSCSIKLPQFDNVKIEYKHNEVRWDLALFNGDCFVCGVEVFYSHRTEDSGTRVLFPWFEVALDKCSWDDSPPLRLVSFHRVQGLRKRCTCERGMAHSSLPKPVTGENQWLMFRDVPFHLRNSVEFLPGANVWAVVR